MGVFLFLYYLELGYFSSALKISGVRARIARATRVFRWVLIFNLTVLKNIYFKHFSVLCVSYELQRRGEDELAKSNVKQAKSLP